MKIAIRDSVFETNSSSMHTIAVKHNSNRILVGMGCESNYISLWDGTYKIYEEDDICFERQPFKILHTFMEKMLYWIASISWKYKGEEEEWLQKEIYPIIKKYYPGFEKIDFPYRDFCNIKTYGYVDHESSNLLKNFLESKNITIEDFCADNKYVIFIDSDEYNFLEDYMQNGLIHREDFAEIFLPWDFVEV